MIEIYTLGKFDIKYNDKSILEAKGYPYKTLKLFKYFLTHEGKRILPENIIEDLWEDNEYKDPYGTLRTQISRVRNMIDLQKLNVRSFFQIEYSNGYYIFRLEKECKLDINEFESKINMVSSTSEYKENEEVLLEIISLYKGSYLQELEDEDWLIPIRSRFDRLYIKILETTFKTLMEKERYHDIIEICEEAIQYKFYEESIHIYFLKALIAVGQEKYAKNHYEYYTSKFYNDLRIAPSKKASEIYKELQSPKKEKSDQILDLNIIKNVLKEDSTKGALLCEFDYFKFLYNFELRSIERNENKSIFLLIITVDNIGYKPLKEEEIDEEMVFLKNIVFNTLRKGDVVSQCNDSQLLVLLYHLEESSLEKVIERVLKKFNEDRKNEKTMLNIKYKKI